jgi:hypothetical protein
VSDEQVLRLIRRYLEAGVMVDGVKQPSEEGTPQGSPLSPLLANVMLDDLDKGLERRGHRFVRYADDIMVHVRSERAGQRVMASITQFVEPRLKLRVDRDKSAVARATKRPFLGFRLLRPRRQCEGAHRPEGADTGQGASVPPHRPQLAHSMEERIEAMNRFSVGWTAYFAFADTPSPFERLDEWLRRRLRQVRWKEWKHCRTRQRNLRGLGIPEGSARQWGASPKGCWRIAGSYVPARALPNAHWAELGLKGFSDPYPPSAGHNANRRMRTRMSGGVGGAGMSPAPTRLLPVRQAQLLLHARRLQRCAYARGSERDLAEAYPGRVEEGVTDCGRNHDLVSLTESARPVLGPVDHHDLLVRDITEPEDRVRNPVAA